jgi:hypothetical protein
VRLTILHDSVVTAFIQKELSGTENGPQIAAHAGRAAGCIGKLLAPIGGAGDADAGRFLEAARKDAVGRYAQALRQTPFQARGGFAAMLEALLERLRTEARAGGDMEKLVAAIAHVADAREAAQGNVNPQLLAAVLADNLSGPAR